MASQRREGTYATIEVEPPGPTPTLVQEIARNWSGVGTVLASIVQEISARGKVRKHFVGVEDLRGFQIGDVPILETSPVDVQPTGIYPPEKGDR